MWGRLAAGLVGAVALVGLAACGGGSGGGHATATAAPRMVDAPPTYRLRGGPPSPALNQEGQVTEPSAPTGVASLPAGFPLPFGAGNKQVSARDAGVDAQLTVPDPGSAYRFWLTALPKAGYLVSSRHLVGATGADIVFTGRGYRNGTIAIRSTAVRVHLLR